MRDDQNVPESITPSGWDSIDPCPENVATDHVDAPPSFVVDHSQLTRAASPGKFEGELAATEFLYNLGQFDATESMDDGGGWWGMIRGPIDVPLVEFLDEGHDLCGLDIVFLRQTAGAIFHEGSDGFVSATYYDIPEELEAAWQEIVDDLNPEGDDDSPFEDSDDDDSCDHSDQCVCRTHYRNGDEITLHGCDGCSPSMINGVLCHETGCPEAWRDHTVSCFECGCEFRPSERYQRVCDDCSDPFALTAADLDESSDVFGL